MAASAALSKAAVAKRGLLMFNNLRPCSSSLLNTKVVPGVPTLHFSNPVASPVRIVPGREGNVEEGIVNRFKSSLLFLDKAPGTLHSDLTRLNVRGRYNDVEIDDEEDDDDFSDGSDEDFSGSDLDDECEAYEDDSDKSEEEKEEVEKPRPRRGAK